MTAVCPEIYAIELSSVGSPCSLAVSLESKLPSRSLGVNGGDGNDDDRHFEHSDETGVVGTRCFSNDAGLSHLSGAEIV